jgi:hypothetical protein
MQDSLPEIPDPAADSGTPTFLARKGVMMREYYVVARWPDGRREKIGRFVRRSDAVHWIAQKSAEWLAQYFARATDLRAGSRPADDGASSSPA